MAQSSLCIGTWLLGFQWVAVAFTHGRRQESGEQKQQRPSSGMAVCITHDLNVSRSVWTGGLPARLTGLTARFTRPGFIDR